MALWWSRGSFEVRDYKAFRRAFMSRVLLASRSPRRRELLEEAGFRVDVDSLDVDEDLQGVDARQVAQALAVRKGAAVFEKSPGFGQDFLIAADTIVWTDDGVQLGKPEDRDDARRMMRLLLGKTHTVTTGFALWRASQAQPVHVGECSARVTMVSLSEGAIEGYLDSDEPWDKAGGYGVQGLAGAFVSRIEGSWHTVVGLPVHAVLSAAQSHGLLVRMPWEKTR